MAAISLTLIDGGEVVAQYGAPGSAEALAFAQHAGRLHPNGELGLNAGNPELRAELWAAFDGARRAKLERKRRHAPQARFEYWRKRLANVTPQAAFLSWAGV
jgi:hypothetical protein